MVRGANAEELRRAEAEEYLTLDAAFCKVKQAFRILGRSNNDKTTALIERILALLEKGINPTDIRVICASQEACLLFSQRLHARNGADNVASVEHIEITTMRTLALDILSTPEAQVLVNRCFCSNRARLLSAFELDFVLEDLKTLGIRPGRLRELLKFFYRGLTELADEGAGWLITIEEQETLAFLRSELQFLQGVIEPELSNLASKALRADDELRNRFAKPHLLADEYQTYNRASQMLCHALATDSICVAANPDNPVEISDSFPYAKGVEEFIQINPDAETILLDKEQRAPVLTTLQWHKPQDEFSGLTELIETKISSGVLAQEIAVVCFHPYWFKHMVSALEEHGISTNNLYQPLTLKGDIRTLDRSIALRIVTALRLLAEPTDSLSWRCWIGFGDYLAKSNVFVEAQREALAINPHAVFLDSLYAWEGWEENNDFLASCSDKTGRELLDYLYWSLSDSDASPVYSHTPQLPAVLSPLLSLGDKATPAEMVAQLEQEQFYPRFSSSTQCSNCVTVTSIEMLSSLSFDQVILVGFVNGFFPLRKYFDLTEITINQQKKLEEEDTRRLNLLLSVTKDNLTISHFKSIDLESAERLRLKTDRIMLKDGKRTSQILLSIHAKTLTELTENSLKE